MTKAHVGSLLVFDPSKLEVAEDEAPDVHKTKRDAVVGIITERGARPGLSRPAPQRQQGAPGDRHGVRAAQTT